MYNLRRYYALQDEIAAKDKELQKLLDEKNTVEKIAKDKEVELEVVKSQLDQTSKKQDLNTQIKQLKETIKEHQKIEKDQELEAQKTNDYIVTLEEKYRIVLEKTGYNPEQDKIIQQPKWDPKKLDAAKRKKKIMDMDWGKPGEEKTDDDDALIVYPSL